MDIHSLYNIYKKHPHVCTDSRAVKQGDLFFALRGDSFDGNKFAPGALEQGAAYVVIDDAQYKQDDRYILVEDVLQTLQELALYHRRRFKIPVFGLTGSNGKTTTKELIASVLKEKYKVHATSGNFNNHIGVPLTLLSMPVDTEIAVIEMGANHPGEIAFLCAIAEPTHGLITNVGKAHLEGFGSFEGVRKTKAEIFTWLAGIDGVGFVNQNEPYLEEMARAVRKKIFFGKDGRAELAGASPFVEFFIAAGAEKVKVKTQIIGAYNFNNILTAITVGQFFDVPVKAIRLALENYLPQNNRSQLLEKDGNTYIMDAYNANPVSMEKALLSFSEMDQAGKRKIAIIGDMRELGSVSEEEHRKMVSLVQNLQIDTVVFVGPEFAKVTREGNYIHFDHAAEAKTWFQKQAPSGALILLKGSRGIRLEEVVS